MSLMTTTLAVPEAVNHVFDNLWERGARELEMLGFSNEMARGFVAYQVQAGMPTLALWFDNEPVVIMGLARSDNPNAMSTWFQATELFTEFARPITEELRRQIAHVGETRNLDYVEIISPCVHPHAGRWFRALGFNLDVNRFIPIREGSQERLYRFERRFVKEGKNVLPQG